MRLTTDPLRAGAALASVLVFLLLASTPNVPGQEETPPAGGEQEMTEEDYQRLFLEELEKLGWQREGSGELGKWARIEIPAGFRFTGGDGAEELLKMTGNIPDGSENGVIATEGFDWWVLFRFNDVGYIKDDEKDDIDPTKLLRQKKEAQDYGNEQRRDMGLDELFVDGWAREPFYNEETNNLEWALLLRDSAGSMSVNYNSKILGRRGFMDAVLVCDPEQLDTVLPEFQNLIRGFEYQDGQSYAEYKDGDKIAKIGLTALIVGGGAAVAAKTGLFAGLFKIIAKGGKAVILGIVALFAGVVKAFQRLFGRGE